MSANDQKQTTGPRKLQKSRVYPTYQLYAAAGDNKKLTPDEKLVYCVLAAMRWMRSRLHENEIPDKLKFPEPDNFRDVKFTDFESFERNPGYKLEVISLPDEKKWALRLTEPDLLSTSDIGEERTPPVPGRLIETNIAFSLTSGTVECAVCINVTDPENVKSQAENWRPSVVKDLAGASEIGLLQGPYKFAQTAYEIKSTANLKSLAKWLGSDERTIPAVLLCENEKRFEIEFVQEINIVALSGGFVPNLDIAASRLKREPVLKTNNTTQSQWPIEPSVLANSRYIMGFCQIFQVEKAFVPKLAESGFDAKPGDILFVEPRRFCKAKNMLQKMNNKSTDELLKAIQMYSRDKSNYYYGDVLFVPKAREIQLQTQLENAISNAAGIEETESHYRALIDEIEKRHQKEIEEIKKQNIHDTRELEKHIKDRDDALAERNNRCAALAQSLEILEDNIRKRDALIKDLEERAETISRRPKKIDDYEQWVESEFEGRVLLKLNSQGKSNLKNATVDLNLLCNATEYLACEYRALRMGELTESEVNDNCAKKYRRRFEVCSNGDTSISMYKNQYHIKYNPSYQGKPMESPLTEHLKIGNKTEDLIRIYFLYDKEKNLVVIGSLPRHLDVVSQ